MRKAQRKRRFALQRKKIAKERIEILFEKIKKHPKSKYAPRYSKLIFSLSKKYRVPKPAQLIKSHCPKCLRYQIIGKTQKIRIKNRRKVRICLCGKSF